MTKYATYYYELYHIQCKHLTVSQIAIAGKEVVDVDVTIAVEDEKGNSIAGKEVVDVTIALEDEKGNSIAGKEVVDVTMLQPIHQLDCNPVFYTLKCYFFHHY